MVRAENQALVKLQSASDAACQVFFSSGPPSSLLENVWLHRNLELALPSIVPPGHVRVKLTARPIQPVDSRIIRTIAYEELRSRDVVVLGAEGVGTVHEIGEGVVGFHRDQRVVPVVFWHNLIKQGTGSWQYYVDVAQENVMVLPDVPTDLPGYVPDFAASQFVITPWTALGLFHTAVGDMPKDAWLLLSAPSSTIGRHILGMTKHNGVNVIAVVRKDDQKKILTDLGFPHAVNGQSEDLASQVKCLTGGKGAHAAIDGVGANTTMILAASVRNEGKVLVYGNAAGSQDDDHVKIRLRDLKRRVVVQWWTLTEYLHIGSGDTAKIHETMQKLFKETTELFVNKVIELPAHSKTFKLNQLAEALECAEQIKDQSKKQKVILVNDE